jgi:hypothetical protein
VSYETNNHNDRDRDNEPLYSKRLKAGKRRTYFFDVRTTRGNDYFLTITESKKRFNDDGYDRHKIFLYKEDFNKFIAALTDAVDHVKTELLPDFDFDSFSHEDYESHEGGESHHAEPAPAPEVAEAAEVPVSSEAESSEQDIDVDIDVDKW